MRTFILLFLAIYSTSNSAQECAELYISEIVFGGNITLLETNVNHSVEIFNPSPFEIDLSAYEISLISTSGESSTTISLFGNINPGDVYVVSHPSASEDQTVLTDKQEAKLNFSGQASLELRKNGETIDKVGNVGSGTPDVIDFDRLLTDPAYLNSLSIDLGIIKNLSLRRSRLVRQGSPTFQNVSLLKQWAINPSTIITDLGFHTCSCLVPIVYWDGADMLSWEQESFKFEQETHFGTVVVEPPADEDITVFLIESSFLVPVNVGIAISPIDYALLVDPTVDFTINANETGRTFDLLTVNNTPEPGDKGAGMEVGISDPGQTGATVEISKQLIDFLIKDLNTSTAELEVSNSITLFPTVFDESVTIQIDDPSLKIDNISIIGIDARSFRQIGIEHPIVEYGTLDLADCTTPGFYKVLLNTNKGVVTKTICRF